MEILWKGIGPAEFWAICPKSCKMCTFSKNFHIRKLGEILAFYAVQYLEFVNIKIKCFNINFSGI